MQKPAARRLPTWSAFALAVAIALAAPLSSAGEAFAPREMLTPEEIAAREEEKKRKAPPVLEVEPAELKGTVKQGRSVDLAFTIRNAGGGTLRWSVPTTPPWMRLDSRSGELAFGEQRKLFATAEASDLAVGTLRAYIVIEAPGAKGSPKPIPIVLNVGERDPNDVDPTDLYSKRKKKLHFVAGIEGILGLWAGDYAPPYDAETAGWLTVHLELRRGAHSFLVQAHLLRSQTISFATPTEEISVLYGGDRFLYRYYWTVAKKLEPYAEVGVLSYVVKAESDPPGLWGFEDPDESKGIFSLGGGLRIRFTDEGMAPYFNVGIIRHLNAVSLPGPLEYLQISEYPCVTVGLGVAF
jgi:hypothetical protein